MDENDATDANTPRDAITTMEAAADEVIKDKSIDKDETMTQPAASIETKTTANVKPIPPGWTQDELEQLRLCRNRAYYKVNTKRRQHLQASLSTYLHKEWQSQNPSPTNHSAKELLKIYQEYFEPEVAKKPNGIAPAGGRGGWNRGRGRGGGHHARGGGAARNVVVPVRVVPDSNAIEKLKTIEDHSDKQWTECMLSNLMHCNQIVADRQAFLMGNPTGDKFDFSSFLHEEWLKIYPHSTLSARNIKSRLTVYMKTMGDTPSPNRRRKLATPQESFLWTVDKKDLFRTLLEKYSDQENLNENEKLDSIHQTMSTHQGCSNLSLQEVRSMANLMVTMENVSKSNSSSKMKIREIEEVTDEFAPEVPNNDDDSSMTAVLTSPAASNDTNNTDSNSIRNSNEKSANNSSNGTEVFCEKNHWVHLFSDSDVNVECVLTEQLLQIRKSLKGSFKGCDIYKPKKPKGLATMVLDEWKRYYPDSEETNKTIGFKLAKYDRGPSSNAPNSNDKVKVGATGRTFWSPQMLQTLQETRSTAQTIVARSGREISLTKAWKDEWTKAYPDLNLDWRTVLSRYHYHFGNNLDNKPETENNSTGNQQQNSVEMKDFSEKFENGGGKVKGFRNWTQSMEVDLIETKAKVLKADSTLEKGSSEFNRALLKEFTKLYPKCMESSRSLYSRLQSVEKERGSAMVTPNSTPRATPVRSQSVEFTPKSINENDSEIKEEKVISEEPSTVYANLKTVTTKMEIKTEPQSPPPPPSLPTTSVVSEEVPNNTFEQPLKVEIKEEKVEHQENENESKKEEVVPIKQQPPPAVDTELLTSIKGFEEWTRSMIKDFIDCMGKARQKYNTLKEQNPNTDVRQVAMLLDEWKLVYPESRETVQSFVDKVRHLKAQKELIKKHLAQPEQPSMTPEQGKPFKWSPEMMPDVIESRQRAFELKQDEEKSNGRKLSHNSLWEAEFKKIYPNSNFTSNNLSVHFWTWKKKQQKLAKKQGIPVKEVVNSNINPLTKKVSVQNHPIRDTIPRDELLSVGRKVEQMLQNPKTPNELKLQGFANVLHEEWKKDHPDSSESSRSLNMMYSRLLRQDDPQELTTIYATWTPKHNGVLKDCLEHNPRSENESDQLFLARIAKSWRSKFPKSSVTDEDLIKKIVDTLHIKDPNAIEFDQGSALEGRPSPSKKMKLDHTTKIIKVEKVEEDPETTRKPNSRGQMNWNRQAITDLLDCHKSSQLEQRNLSLESTKKIPKLSELVHSKFIALHPYCKLTPAILMTKCYTWKSAVEKGSMKIELNSSNTISGGLKSNSSNEHSNQPKMRPRSSSKDLVLRTWTQEMIDNMLKTRKLALTKRKEQGKSDMHNLTELWYEEFLKLHPDYKSSKKNLWRKYKWYKSRMAEVKGENSANIPAASYEAEFDNALDEKAGDSEEEPQPLLRMKNIRKDVFHYLKAVLEESRIFLPMKLPEDTFSPPPIQEQQVQVTETVTYTASQALASFQQQALLQHPSMEVTDEIVTTQEIHMEQPVPIQPQTATTSSTSSNTSHIKLPGGATLVAVTDRNVDQIIKPKTLEKPHVTITIGDKQQAMMDPLAIATSSINLPVHLPEMTNFPSNLVQPPPLPQLKIYSSSEIIPQRIRSRLEELGIHDQMMMELLKIYESVREEYIELLKKGFLVFFPYLLGTRWRENFPNSLLTGRKLTTLVDIFVEEKRRGRIISPEYLTKVPCGFEVTELVLKQILVCHADTKRKLLGQNFSNNTNEVDFNAEAKLYVQMCRRWSKIHPEVKLTMKQMISIHHMLNFEPGKDDPSPELICYLSESLRNMEKEVPEERTFDPRYQHVPDEEMDISGYDLDVTTYDESNLSLEQLQELFLATQGIPESSLNQHHHQRPHLVTKKKKLLWTSKRVEDLKLSSELAMQKFKCNKKSSIKDFLCLEWYKLNPDMKIKVSKSQILARYKFQVRYEKKCFKKNSQKIIQSWQTMCDSYRINEESIEVINETIKQEEAVNNQNDSKSGGTPTGNGNDKPLTMEYNPDLQSRDYNRDEDVLSYLRDQQANSKSQHNITWTPEVIADLIDARKEARRRKKVWEEWAIRKYGGVGIAYNNPNVTFSKVDDMFKEEWAKRRPALANLSIWTLVSYARKFDSLKKQLIQDHNQVNRVGDRRKKGYVEPDPTPIMSTEQRSGIIYFNESSIPKYDLDEVQQLPISQDLKDLLATRQLAKIKQESDTLKLRLYHLWQEEWKKLRPDLPDLSGALLHQRLFLLENRSSNKSKLKQAVLRSTQNPGKAQDCEDEQLCIKPRHYVFPEADKEGLNIFCYIDVPLPSGQKERWYVELERDVYNKESLRIPMLEDGRGPADEEEEISKFPAKAYNHLDLNLAAKFTVVNSELDQFKCHSCETLYSNVNNLKYHQELHHESVMNNEDFIIAKPT